MRLRELLLIVPVLVGATLAIVAADWQKQESGSLAWLQAVAFVDADRGFAAGSNGTLLATETGGLSWRKVTVPTADMIRDLHFVDRFNGWMLCDPDRNAAPKRPEYLLRSTDSGRTWTRVEIEGPHDRFGRIVPGRDGAIFLVGEGGAIIVFNGDGSTPMKRWLPIRYLIVSGAAPGESRIVLAGGGGTLIHSDDDGRNWKNAEFVGEHPERKLNSVFFVNSQTGWTVGGGGLIFSTGDGGRSWRPQSSSTTADLLDIRFIDPTFGFTVGDGGTVLSTSDRGITWATERSGTKHRLERLAFAGRRVVAVGFGGTIITTNIDERRYRNLKSSREN